MTGDHDGDTFTALVLHWFDLDLDRLDVFRDSKGAEVVPPNGNTALGTDELVGQVRRRG